MPDFASAVLVAAARRALIADGIPVALAAPRAALLPLAAKRQFLTEVAGVHGLLPLLRVGRVVPDLPPDPATAALAAARDPEALFRRWRRLERFLHSRHRVVVLDAGSTFLTAEHAGPAGAAPLPAEDALVLGVLTVLTAATGARDLVVQADPDDPVTVFADGAFHEPVPGRDLRRWRFAWSSLGPPPDRGARPPAGGDLGSYVRGLFATDLGHRWTLRETAAHAGVSARGLQRHLSGDGGFSTVLGASRAQAAAGLLTGTRHPLGVIGFACGYADQPHFTRDFKRRTAMTPAAYRTAFAHEPDEAATAFAHEPDEAATAQPGPDQR